MMKRIFKPFIQEYLRILTKLILWRHKPLVVAVTGTSNKTFVKETILEELGRGPEVRGNPKSFNTEIGLPLAVLFVPSGYSSVYKWVDVLLTGTCISIFSRQFPKVLVLELGTDRKGDMEYLLSMVRPKIAVVTQVDRSFPDNNTNMDDVSQEIGYLVETLPEDGVAVLNSDDVRVAKLAGLFKGKTILYGKGAQALAKISNIKTEACGQSFVLSYAGETKKIEIERFGMHNVYAQVIAKIVAKELETITK